MDTCNFQTYSKQLDLEILKLSSGKRRIFDKSPISSFLATLIMLWYKGFLQRAAVWELFARIERRDCWKDAPWTQPGGQSGGRAPAGTTWWACAGPKWTGASHFHFSIASGIAYKRCVVTTYGRATNRGEHACAPGALLAKSGPACRQRASLPSFTSITTSTWAVMPVLVARAPWRDAWKSCTWTMLPYLYRLSVHVDVYMDMLCKIIHVHVHVHCW